MDFWLARPALGLARNCSRERRGVFPWRRRSERWDEGGGPPLKPATIHKVYAGRTGDSYLTRPTEELGRIDAYLAEPGNKGGECPIRRRRDDSPDEGRGGAAKAGSGRRALDRASLRAWRRCARRSGSWWTRACPRPCSRSLSAATAGWTFPAGSKEGKKVVLLPTSDWSALDRVAGLMRVPGWLKQTRILAVGAPHGTAAACEAEKVKAALGAELVTITQRPRDGVLPGGRPGGRRGGSRGVLDQPGA